jgi:methionine biosynthesis protein MetW
MPLFLFQILAIGAIGSTWPLTAKCRLRKACAYQWYDTPNIHFCTIIDFVKLCESLDLSIEKSIYVTEAGVSSSLLNNKHFANLFGQQGIFMVK